MTNTGNTSNSKLFLLITLCAIVLDQLTKYILKETQSTVIPFIFEISSTQNFGAGFGILQNRRWIFIIVTIIVLLYVFSQWKEVTHSQQSSIYFALIIGGAIGNLIDRILLGYVIDFFKFATFPTFNIADIAITSGAIGLIILYWKK